MSKYYPCWTTSAPVSDHSTYYRCSKEAYSKVDAMRVLKDALKYDSRAGGSVMLVEKKGPFGIFSKFPDKFWDVYYYGGLLNNLNTKEELTKFPDKVTGQTT